MPYKVDDYVTYARTGESAKKQLYCAAQIVKIYTDSDDLPKPTKTNRVPKSFAEDEEPSSDYPWAAFKTIKTGKTAYYPVSRITGYKELDEEEEAAFLKLSKSSSSSSSSKRKSDASSDDDGKAAPAPSKKAKKNK